jgi:hypothetical protein
MKPTNFSAIIAKKNNLTPIYAQRDKFHATFFRKEYHNKKTSPFFSPKSAAYLGDG